MDKGRDNKTSTPEAGARQAAEAESTGVASLSAAGGSSGEDRGQP